MKTLKIAVVIAAVAVFLFACGQTAVTRNDNSSNANSRAADVPANTQPSSSPDEVAMGKDLYASNCAACHKDTGQGGKVTIDGKELKPTDLTSDKMKKHTDDKLVEHISDGAPDDGMPAFKAKLTQDQIHAIMKYVRQLQNG